MMDTQAKLIHAKIWDLLSDYADIRDELEDAFGSIRLLYEELDLALTDIGDELDDIEAHISSVSRSLRRFQCPGDQNTPVSKQDIREELPWN